jgi:hypothetical protein
VRVRPNDPPRLFRAGTAELKDCASVDLEPDEQVTFVTEAGGEYDVARKTWGFYATPSLNGRLPRSGLRPAIVRNADAKYYVLLVEQGHEAEFDAYCRAEAMSVVVWLDDEHLASLEGRST